MRFVAARSAVALFALLTLSTPLFAQSPPPLSGSLIDLGSGIAVSTITTDHAQIASNADPKTKAVTINFDGGTDYPGVHFPVPQGGWDLSPYAGVEVMLTNAGSDDVQAGLRVDNAGDWHQSPWVQAGVHLKPGESHRLRINFGLSSYHLDPSKIIAVLLFVDHPKTGASLVVKDLAAFGDPGQRVSTATYSSEAGRNQPVDPPAWLGKHPPVDGDWVKTLDENFDGDSLNPKIWTTHVSWGNGLIPNQTQAYSDSDLSVDHGVLTMKFEKRTIHQYDDPKLPVMDYATAYLATWGKWTQTYGYFEARIKLPTTRGLWPAFWLMPDRGPSTDPQWIREDTHNGGMEFDIMEHLTEWGPGKYNVAVHWDGYDADHQSWGDADTFYGKTPGDWHAFGLLWEPGKATFYCDGVKKAEISTTRIGSVPGYIILNIQSGGWATKDVDLAHLPDKMQVDYVRAWQLRSRINPPPTTASSN